MSRFAALIPIKAHSRRMPGKHLRPLAGKPLFAWVITQLRLIEMIDQIVVDTDSDEIEAAIRQHFTDVRILRRPVELSGDDVTMNQLIAHQMDQIGADAYLQTHCTNPLLTAKTIEAAIAALRANPDKDSLFSVTELRGRLYWPDKRAVNHNPDELVPLDALPIMLRENANLYLFTPESFARRHHRIGEDAMMFAIDAQEAMQIENEQDFAMAEFLLQQRLAG